MEGGGLSEGHFVRARFGTALRMNTLVLAGLRAVRVAAVSSDSDDPQTKMLGQRVEIRIVVQQFMTVLRTVMPRLRNNR